MDETTDIISKSQLSTILQYANSEGAKKIFGICRRQS